MPKFFKRRSQKAGMPPGTLMYVGEKSTFETQINLIDYNSDHFEEKKIKDISECFSYKNKPGVTWIDIEGLSKIDVLELLGTEYSLHPLVMEDIINTDQRPKMEEYDDYVYIVVKMIHLHTDKNELHTEQVSIILGANFVITFQEGVEGDTFNSIRERIRSGKGKICKMGADYLAYSLVDSIVDNYFTVQEQFGEKIEDLEEELVAHPDKSTLKTIYEIKREMLFLRKSVWPLREVISRMERGETPLINEQLHVYLRDLYDHTINVIDTIETYRDMLSGMLDIYLSSISNRMNEVMKVLTIITTIFIPLSFIAGVYGMNFEFMPELHMKIAYPVVLTIMVIIAVVMLLIFRKKKWF